MNSKKRRTNAKKIAAIANGVTSAALDGADKDRIVVIGEGVDWVNLARSLRKKVGHANIMSVREENGKWKDEKKGEEKYPWQVTSYHVPYYYSYPPTYEVVSESNPNNCTIL